MSAAVERAVTASRKARWEPGTGAKMFSPLVFRAEPHEPSGFCRFFRNSHPSVYGVENGCLCRKLDLGQAYRSFNSRIIRNCGDRENERQWDAGDAKHRGGLGEEVA